MTKYKKPTYIIIQEAMAERIEIIMDYEWKQMQEQATFLKANTRKWRARCN